MKKILIFCWIFTLITSCARESKNKNLMYQNIVILSDMSSRVKNKPLKDIEKIKEILHFFREECVKPGKKIGDKSVILFSTFSREVVTSIDLNNFKSLAKKQRFVNSTGEFKDSGLNKKIQDFEQEVITTYNNSNDPGLDLISILTEKIKNESIIKENSYLTDGIDTTFVNFDNHINIFTDGYLEYKGKSINDEYYFGESEINEIRKVCLLKNITISEVLELNESFKLPAVKDKKNKHINLHILETHQRDKNYTFQTFSNRKGTRDNEILKVIWETWARESGFKSFEWKIY